MAELEFFSTIYLANGEQARATVTGRYEESAYASVQGREIKVGPLPDAWQSLGYGEIVPITLQGGETINAVLAPDGYINHVAYLYNDDSIEATICVYDAGAWREMTDQEYEAERRAWSEDMKDQQRIKDQWRAYRNEEPIPPDYERTSTIENIATSVDDKDIDEWLARRSESE